VDSSPPNATHPDWGLRIGCGTWVIIAVVAAWAIFHALGWHISRTMIYWMIGFVAYQYVEYRFDVLNQAYKELAVKTEKLDERLEQIENLIPSIQRALWDRD
jgi:hypothetical protein